MIYMCDIQLGDAEQKIYKIENDGLLQKEHMIVKAEDLGKTLCDLYYTNNADKIVICGPQMYTSNIQKKAQEHKNIKYANAKELNIELI